MEDIRFFDAVRLGDILHLSSHVVWSDKDELQIQVTLEHMPTHSIWEGATPAGAPYLEYVDNLPSSAVGGGIEQCCRPPT